MRNVQLLSSFNKWRNQDTYRFSIFPKVTELGFELGSWTSVSFLTTMLKEWWFKREWSHHSLLLGSFRIINHCLFTLILWLSQSPYDFLCVLLFSTFGLSSILFWWIMSTLLFPSGYFMFEFSKKPLETSASPFWSFTCSFLEAYRN